MDKLINTLKSDEMLMMDVKNIIINTSEVASRNLVFYFFEKGSLPGIFQLDPNGVWDKLLEVYTDSPPPVSDFLPSNSTPLSISKQTA